MESLQEFPQPQSRGTPRRALLAARSTILLVLGSLVGSWPGLLAGQQPGTSRTPALGDLSPNEAARVLFATVRELQQARMGDVRDFTVVEEADGVLTTSYYERQMVDGRRLFVSVNVSPASVASPTPREATPEVGPLGLLLPESIEENARVLGTEVVDGHETHVVVVEPVSASELGVSLQDTNQRVRFTSATVLVDADDFVPRRLTLEGEEESGEGRFPFTVTIDLSDYRESSGMLHAFRRRTVIRVPPTLSPSDRKEMEKAQAQFDEMEKQLARLPEAQRRMVEAQMGQQRQQFEAMMSTEGTELTFTTETRELHVNEGPPIELRADRAGSPATEWSADVSGVLSYGLTGSLAAIESGEPLATLTLRGTTTDGVAPPSTIRIEFPSSDLAVGELLGRASVTIQSEDGSGGTFETEVGGVRLRFTSITEDTVTGGFELGASGTIRDRLGEDTGSVTISGEFTAVVLTGELP